MTALCDLSHNVVPMNLREQTLMLYFHSKGMHNGDQAALRHMLFTDVVAPWRNVVKEFAQLPRLNRAGLLYVSSHVSKKT